MALNEYVQSGGKYLRCGYTTGTCAALAASAAMELLLTGRPPENVALVTPKGIRVEVIPELCEYADRTAPASMTAGESAASMTAGESAASMAAEESVASMAAEESVVSMAAEESAAGMSARAAVRKDAGDDQDVTDGILIAAEVTAYPEIENEKGLEIRIEGGSGVGRITKPGLDQPVGSAAINHVPREMIERAVRKACGAAGFQGRVDVVISVPDGEKIAKKTFNEHLGIVGGISILGTSGIVEPMSMQAFSDAVCVEIRQVRKMSQSGRLILTPGNYGMDFLKEQGILRGESRTSGDGETSAQEFPIVMCSNFIGDALDAASAEGFREVLLIGHIGKLVKVAGGIMNTHSRYADCRMELFAAHAAICEANGDICRRLMHCVSTDACLDILKETGLCDEVMRALMESMEKYLLRRVNGAYEVGAVTFSNVHGFLGATPGAGKMLERYRLENVIGESDWYILSEPVRERRTL